MNIQEQDLIQFLRTKGKTSKTGKKSGLELGTIVTRKSRIFIFLRWLEECRKPLIPESIEEFFIYLQDIKNLSNTSLNTYYNALRSLENYLIDRGRTNGFMEGFGTYSEEDPNITPLTSTEIQVIKRNCAKARNTLEETRFTMTLVFIDSGMRWEDVQGLYVSSINLPGRELIFNQLKTGKRHVVYLDDQLLTLLTKQIEGKSSSDLVFTNNNGGIMHQPDFHKWLKGFCKGLGITKRVSPHIFRHSYGQNGYDKTKDIYLIKDLLGQKNIKSTLRYVKNSTETIKQAQRTHPHQFDKLSFYDRLKIYREGEKKLRESLAKSPEEERRMVEGLRAFE